MDFQGPQSTSWRNSLYPCMEKHSEDEQDNFFYIYKCCDYRLIQTLTVSTSKTVPLLIEIYSLLVIQSKFQSDDLREIFLKSHNCKISLQNLPNTLTL